MADYWFVGPLGLKSQVCRIAFAGGGIEKLAEASYVHAVAFLAYGRPIWSVAESEGDGKPATSQLKVLGKTGRATTVLTVEGVVDRIGVAPGDARGLYLRLYTSTSVKEAVGPQPERLAW